MKSDNEATFCANIQDRLEEIMETHEPRKIVYGVYNRFVLLHEDEYAKLNRFYMRENGAFRVSGSENERTPCDALECCLDEALKEYIAAPGDTQAVRLQKKMRLASLLLDVDADAPKEQSADEEAYPAREAATEHAS